MLKAHDWLKAVTELCVLCDDTQYTLKIRVHFWSIPVFSRMYLCK